MQKDYTKIKTISLAAILITAVITLLRVALLFFGFDFEEMFFANDTLAYALFGAFIIGTFVSFFLARGIEAKLIAPQEKTVLSEILLSLAAVVFIALTILYVIKLSDYSSATAEVKNPLKSVSYIICLPMAVLSVIYYLIRLFTSNKKSASVSFIAVCPVIFLCSLLLERFATVSASASSLSHFPDIISLLVLAAYMLNEGKAFIPNIEIKNSRLPIVFMTITALSFSAIPDLLAFILPTNALYFEGVIYLILKLLFIVYSITEAVQFSKTLKENEK